MSQKTTLSDQATWTEPELCHYGYDMTKPWFVYFDFTDHDLGQTVRKQFRNGINYEKRKEERLRLGNELRLFLKDKLLKGWNPIRGEDAKPTDIPANVRAAIDLVYSLKESSLKKKSLRNYKDIKNMFLAWCERYKYDQYPLYRFNDKIAQAYLDYLLLERKYSGKSHNNQLGIIKGFFNVICRRWKQVIPDNPFAGIPELPETTGKNIAYTEEEARALMVYLKWRDKRLYYAASIMFHCFIRKTELTELKVRDFNWQAGTITVNGDAAKNRKQESATIPEGLLQILQEMQLEKYPPNDYVFGKDMETCSLKISKPDILSYRHKKYIDEIRDVYNVTVLPAGKKAAKQFTFEYEAEAAVIASIHADKTFYSWKHTGVVMYWHVVKDIYYMMRQLRHHDMQTTMVYLKSLGLMPNEAFRKANISL